jgi:hypothetical protein
VKIFQMNKAICINLYLNRQISLEKDQNVLICDLKMCFIHILQLGKEFPLYSPTLEPLGRFLEFNVLNWSEFH